MGGLQGIKSQESSTFEVGKYVACMYDEDWYIGIVEARSEEQQDLHIKVEIHAEGCNRVFTFMATKR